MITVPYHTYTNENGLVFLTRCKNCGRFVKIDDRVKKLDTDDLDNPHATCSKCGETQLKFYTDLDTLDDEETAFRHFRLGE